MARYIKKEMMDLNNAGKTIFTYRMQTIPMDSDEFIRDCVRNTTFSEGELRGMLGIMADCLAQRMARGYSVTIEGLGTFKAQVGMSRDARQRMEEEEKQTAARATDGGDGSQQEEKEKPHSLNARSLEVTGVLWKPAKSLVGETRMACNLERGGTERLRTSKYTLEERRARALAFIKQNTVMRVGDYVRLTGLSHTKAAAELKELCRDENSGITSEGTYGSKVFLAKNSSLGS